MQNYANKYIRLSDISAYMLCPRLAYFRRRRQQIAMSPEMVRAAVFKELSRSLASVIEAGDPETALRTNVEEACVDAEIAYGIPMDRIREEAICGVSDIIAGLHTEAARIGRDRLLAILNPYDKSRIVYSDRLHISGSIDRIIMQEGSRCPVVVCASQPPENGIYAADRIKLAACSLLVEEKYGEAVERGMVEYVCGWRVRETEIRKRDRMAVLSARNRIHQMGSSMPEASRGSWCHGCQYSDACKVKVSFVDSLFGPLLTDSSSPGRARRDK